MPCGCFFVGRNRIVEDKKMPLYSLSLSLSHVNVMPLHLLKPKAVKPFISLQLAFLIFLTLTLQTQTKPQNSLFLYIYNLKEEVTYKFDQVGEGIKIITGNKQNAQCISQQCST
ncbi:hypothetical protein ACOSP7_015430 [Xanthoceras sorbifolium]